MCVCVCVSVCLPVCLSACLSVCLCARVHFVCTGMSVSSLTTRFLLYCSAVDGGGAERCAAHTDRAAAQAHRLLAGAWAAQGACVCI